MRQLGLNAGARLASQAWIAFLECKATIVPMHAIDHLPQKIKHNNLITNIFFTTTAPHTVTYCLHYNHNDGRTHDKTRQLSLIGQSQTIPPTLFCASQHLPFGAITSAFLGTVKRFVRGFDQLLHVILGIGYNRRNPHRNSHNFMW